VTEVTSGFNSNWRWWNAIHNSK